MTPNNTSLYALVLACVLLASGCDGEQLQSPIKNNTGNIAKTTMTHDTKGQQRQFDVALFSYLDRPIFDVYMNKRDIGLAAGQPHRGSGGLMTGVPIQLGPQKITWRLDGVDAKDVPYKDNGNTVIAANIPDFKDPGPDYPYLGVHIYPDNTVELVPEKFWPEKTAKGEAINAEWERKHAQ